MQSRGLAGPHRHSEVIFVGWLYYYCYFSWFCVETSFFYRLISKSSLCLQFDLGLCTSLVLTRLKFKSQKSCLSSHEGSSVLHICCFHRGKKLQHVFHFSIYFDRLVNSFHAVCIVTSSKCGKIPCSASIFVISGKDHFW